VSKQISTQASSVLKHRPHGDAVQN